MIKNKILNALREVMYWIAICYDFLGITRLITRTDRYWSLRPADALFMEILTGIFVLFGMPIFSILWVIFQFPVWVFAMGLLGLFALPPVITYALCEFFLWKAK